MKVYMITDMEGVAGIVIEEQTFLSGRLYNEARLLLTKEVNAAVEGAIEGGADEVIVNDGHNGGFNLVLDELHEEAKIVHGAPRTMSLAGLDETVDIVFLIGYHAMAGTPRGVLDHTMSSLAIHNIYLNGVRVGEIGLMAAIAGYYDVPVGLVTGCVKACEEAKNLLGNVEVVITKWGFGRCYAMSISPKKSRKLIRESSKRAVERAFKNEFKPYKVKAPVEVKIEYNQTKYADSWEGKEGILRLDSRTIACRGDDLIRVLRTLGLC